MGVVGSCCGRHEHVAAVTLQSFSSSSVVGLGVAVVVGPVGLVISGGGGGGAVMVVLL